VPEGLDASFSGLEIFFSCGLDQDRRRLGWFEPCKLLGRHCLEKGLSFRKHVQQGGHGAAAVMAERPDCRFGNVPVTVALHDETQDGRGVRVSDAGELFDDLQAQLGVVVHADRLRHVEGLERFGLVRKRDRPRRGEPCLAARDAIKVLGRAKVDAPVRNRRRCVAGLVAQCVDRDRAHLGFGPVRCGSVEHVRARLFISPVDAIAGCDGRSGEAGPDPMAQDAPSSPVHEGDAPVIAGDQEQALVQQRRGNVGAAGGHPHAHVGVGDVAASAGIDRHGWSVAAAGGEHEAVFVERRRCRRVLHAPAGPELFAGGRVVGGDRLGVDDDLAATFVYEADRRRVVKSALARGAPTFLAGTFVESDDEALTLVVTLVHDQVIAQDRRTGHVVRVVEGPQRRLPCHAS
jgi:hypothetical protein